MLTPDYISQWLKSPHPVADEAALDAALQQYPYFLPLRYMAAATRDALIHETAGAYATHHLIFNSLMSAVKKPADSRTVVQHQPQIICEPADDEAFIIRPVFTEDYFLHQGLPTEDTLPEAEALQAEPEDPKSLMVMMSFTDWLMHFRKKTEQEAEEAESRRAVRNMWQKEKLAAAMEEDGEDDEIPEDVFKMAVDSIAKEDGLVSESLAEILVKQQKWSKAIDMYRRLSLTNPTKSAYFATRIESLQKLITENS